MVRCTLVSVFALFLHSCVFFTKTEKGTQPGPTLLYRCDMSMVSQINEWVTLSFSWYPPAKGAKSTAQRVLVSDGDYENSESALIVILDRTNQKIEQAKKMNGEPIETTMVESRVEKHVATRLFYLRFSELILSNSAKQITEATQTPQSSAKGTFLFESREFKLTPNAQVDSPYGYGKLPKSILTDKDKAVCSLTRP